MGTTAFHSSPFRPDCGSKNSTWHFIGFAYSEDIGTLDILFFVPNWHDMQIWVWQVVIDMHEDRTNRNGNEWYIYHMYIAWTRGNSNDRLRSTEVQPWGVRPRNWKVQDRISSRLIEFFCIMILEQELEFACRLCDTRRMKMVPYFAAFWGICEAWGSRFRKNFGSFWCWHL